MVPRAVFESGVGRPGWASCQSGWLSRWTYVVCLCRPLTLVVDGIAATEEGSERVRYVVSCGVRWVGEFVGTARGCERGFLGWFSRARSQRLCAARIARRV